MELPLISVVIPTYNEEQDIRRTLDAALQTADAGTEIIVVDDGSDDGSPALLADGRYSLRPTLSVAPGPMPFSLARSSSSAASSPASPPPPPARAAPCGCPPAP